MKKGGASMPNPREIRAIDGFSRIANGDLVSRATNIQAAMTGNTNFPNPPVDLAALKTAIDTFSALIAEALDGSKKVIAERNKQRSAIIKMLKLLGRYVEVASDGDMAIFQTSGFEAAGGFEGSHTRNHVPDRGACADWTQFHGLEYLP
jgi:hypothetical protein